MHNQPREPQLYEDYQASDSRIWVNFTRIGLMLGLRHQEPLHTDVSRNLATVVVRGVLPGLRRRRRTGLLPSGPKSSFQMRASFVLHLETKVLEGWRRSSCLKTSGNFPQSVMILGCNVICWCWSIVFFENQRHCTCLPRNFGALHASFCWPAF